MSELSVVYAFYSPLYDELSGANLIIILHAISINIAVLYICYTRYQMYKELQNYWKVYKMNTTLPILIHSVIGGIGEHPDAKKRSLGYGAIMLYIPIEHMVGSGVLKLMIDVNTLSIYASENPNYLKQPHTINEASHLWNALRFDSASKASRKVIHDNGYVECLFSIPMKVLEPFMGAELIQNELGLPYMAIDQSDKSKCMPIWYDVSKSTNQFIDGNYNDYPGVQPT